MPINPYIFRAYDIRGIYEKDLTANSVYLIGQGFGTYLNGDKNVVCGRDNRIHGEILQTAFIKGLLSTGCNVTNIGLAPSPYLYFSNVSQNFEAGCNVTASHNPSEYNGFKLVSKNAHSVCGDEIQKIKQIINQGHFKKGSGQLKQASFTDKYKEKLHQMFKFQSPLKIVIDTANGIAGDLYPKILRSFGHEVIELYTELDGTFPNHAPDPIIEKNTEDLKKEVIQHQADLGICFDGDGDRCSFIDKYGQFYTADQILLILSRDLLSRHSKSKIVLTVSNSELLISDIKQHGGIPIMTKVGHSFVEETMTKEKALLGGEQSGHFFVKEDYYAYDDAIVTALKILKIMDTTQKPFEELFLDVPKVWNEPEIRPFVKDDQKFELIHNISTYFQKTYNCNTLDGVRISFNNEAWAGIRASNTSPCISICLEARTKQELKNIKELVINHLKTYPEINWNK